MERPVIPMSFAEFEVMERPFGWKVEYWDGYAHLTPRSMGVTTKINLSPRPAPHPYNRILAPVTPDYREQMIDGYFETFSDSVEFCGWPPEEIQASAEKDIGNYFAGKRGEPLSASVLALAPGSQPGLQQLAGLALVILRPDYGTYMDLLYVRPAFQRQGIATAMLNWVIDRLLESGFQNLSSAYHICNEPSRLWHHRYGFEDVYDWYYARLKADWYRSEIWRREKLGLIEGLADLKQAHDRWVAQSDPEDGD